MGVYTYSIKELPITSNAGGSSPPTPDSQGSIPGVWSAGEYISCSGTYLVNAPTGISIFVYYYSGGNWLAQGTDTLSISSLGGNFSINGTPSAANLKAAFNRKLPVGIKISGPATSDVTLNSLTFQLTGVSLAPPSVGISMPVKMGNLFFFNPTFPEPSLGGLNTPPTYPDPQFNNPQYEDAFSPYPSGGLRSRAREGNDRQGNRGKMSCLVPKQTVYLTIPGNLVLPQNFPVMVILNYPNTTAQWLKWNPGLYNAGGSPSQIEARIYQGNPGSAQPGIWVPSVGLTNLRPVWVGQGSYSDLIPWGGQPMQLVIELAGISNIPAGSFFDTVLEGFDSD